MAKAITARGQPIPGPRLLELGHGADVAGAELLGVALLAALEGHELADPLLVVGGGVQDLGVVVHRALVDPEHVDAPGERVRAGLEDVGEELLVLGGLQRDLAHLQAAVLDR
jgi:hypothetical protein